MRILVTGGAGYIGSHAVQRLLRDGHAVTVVDDLSRGHPQVIERLRPLGDLAFLETDLGDRPVVAEVMRQRRVEIVMHFGALASVGESVERPLHYYRKNTASTLGLLEAMAEADVPAIVFSSTCATYGEPEPRLIPIDERCPQQPINPYGRSKLVCEQMLFDHAQMREMTGEPFAFAALRYFNVAGCDREGLIGEDHEPETHLIPICLQAALGRRPHVVIFGTDYPTPDGTCLRDYVHVEDLIDAHVAVMSALVPGDRRAYNIGIGRGYSVREVIEACRRVSGVAFTVVPGERRAGDPPSLYNDPTRLREELGWTASITDLDEIIDSAWRWFKANPGGYAA